MVYYNEIDPYAAQWLRNLIAAGLIADGEVDERSIVDVRGSDLRGYTQCHFFAGIGVWSYALRLADWPDDRPVWTGSCPCQGHSSAARGRHVEPDWWPHWLPLIAAIRPATIFGEQVAQSGGWIDSVCDGMEALDYEVGAAILPAVSVGADHLRYRIYFASHADRDGESGCAIDAKAPRMPKPRGEPGIVVRADGAPDPVACMRAFGNAINAEVAAEFIGAYLEAERRDGRQESPSQPRQHG